MSLLVILPLLVGCGGDAGTAAGTHSASGSSSSRSARSGHGSGAGAGARVADPTTSDPGDGATSSPGGTSASASGGASGAAAGGSTGADGPAAAAGVSPGGAFSAGATTTPAGAATSPAGPASGPGATPSQSFAHPSASTPMPTGDLPGWTPAFSDNFTEQSLNTASAWSIYDSPGTSNPNTAWYSPSHVYVSGGELHIDGYLDPGASPTPPDDRVVTGGLGLWHLPQKYGKWEMLVRVDACPDVKYAWLLWPYSDQWPAGDEVDFAEDEGGNRQETTASLIYAGSNGQELVEPKDRDDPTPNFSSWHVIGVEWTPSSIRYTLDGQYWGATHTTHLPPGPMVFVLQAEGKLPAGQTTVGSSSATGCNAQIGWVVQYQYTG